MNTHLGYYPEMGEAKPEAEIESSLSHYDRHYFLDTPLMLSGRGIRHLGTHQPHQLTPLGQRKAGWHKYQVTIAAYDKLCRQYRVAHEMLLD